MLTDGQMQGQTDGRRTTSDPEQSSGELKNQYLAHMTKTLVIAKNMPIIK